jgi:hypothetical protein
MIPLFQHSNIPIVSEANLVLYCCASFSLKKDIGFSKLDRYKMLTQKSPLTVIAVRKKNLSPKSRQDCRSQKLFDNTNAIGFNMADYEL